jgi:hypothetical protein
MLSGRTSKEQRRRRPPAPRLGHDNGPEGRCDVSNPWIGGVQQTSDGKIAKGDVAVTS